MNVFSKIYKSHGYKRVIEIIKTIKEKIINKDPIICKDPIIDDTFRKLTFTDMAFHRKSKQSLEVKPSNFHSMTHRLISFLLSKGNFDKVLLIINTLAKNNSYKGRLIDNLLNKKRKNTLVEKI